MMVEHLKERQAQPLFSCAEYFLQPADRADGPPHSIYMAAALQGEMPQSPLPHPRYTPLQQQRNMEKHQRMKKHAKQMMTAALAAAALSLTALPAQADPKLTPTPHDRAAQHAAPHPAPKAQPPRAPHPAPPPPRRDPRSGPDKPRP